MKRTLKCIVPTLKDINNLRKNPRSSALLKKLRNGDCVKELQILDNDCLKPTIAIASMIPQVGPFVANVCGQIGNINAKLNAALDKAEQTQAMANDPSGTARNAIKAVEEDNEEADDN